MNPLLLGFLAGAGSYLYSWLAPNINSFNGQLMWVGLCACGGFLATFVTTERKHRILLSILAGALALNVLRLGIELIATTKSFILFPFELAGTVAANILGALPGVVLGRLARRAFVETK
jgi:hypothetical protein